MRIRAVHIEGFGCFTERSFEFGEGLTLIVGPNEAGKTTLVRAITAVLFGQQPEEREANKPWAGGAYAGTLELKEGDRTARIRREFETEHVEVTEAGDGGSRTWSGTANPRARGPEIETYREHLKRLVGFEDEGLFKSTLCVEQLALEAEIGADVRARLTGPRRESAEEILGRIEATYEAVSNDRMRKGAKPRLLQQCEQEIAEQAALLEATRGYFDEVRGLQEGKAELAMRLEGLEENQAVAEQLFKEIDELAEARQEKERLSHEVSKLAGERERLTANLDERKRLAEQIERDYKGWETLPEDYGSMLLDVSRRRQEVARSRDEVERLEREVAAAKRRASLLWVLVPLAVLAVAYGAGTYLKLLTYFLIGGGAVSAAIAVVLLIGHATRGRRRRRQEQELAIAAERYGVNQASLKTLDARLAPFIASDDPDAEQRRYDAYRDLRAKLGGVDRALEGAGDLEVVTGQYREKNAALDRTEQRLKELTEANPTLKRYLDGDDPARERERLRAEIERRATTLRDLGAQRHRAEVELKVLTSKQVANESALREEIARLEQRREELERRRDGLGLAIDVLGEAITEYHAVHREALAGTIGELYGRLTGGRYERVRLDKQFAPSLDGLGREGLPVERVSQGARDQLYFAMRIAVAEELSGQVRLPFLLDDPFVNFDDERIAAVYEVLHELASRHQFIILTHNPREKRHVEACLEVG